MLVLVIIGLFTLGLYPVSKFSASKFRSESSDDDAIERQNFRKIFQKMIFNTWLSSNEKEPEIEFGFLA